MRGSCVTNVRAELRNTLTGTAVSVDRMIWDQPDQIVPEMIRV